MKTYVLIANIFLVSLLGQWFIWSRFEFVDKSMWAHQAQYIATNDQRQFNALEAYGHPGTVVALLTILNNHLFGISYETALEISLTFFNALTITACTFLSYILRPKSLWWLGMAGLLIFNPLFAVSTPPSAAAIPLITLLFLIALRLYGQPSNSNTWSAGLGVAAGLSAASRSDITALVFFPLLVFLWPRMGIRKTLITIGAAVVTFVVFNPFMWFMPIQHIQDIVAKGNYHYQDFQPTRLSAISFFLISPLAIFSYVFAGTCLLLGRQKTILDIPSRFLIAMLGITLGIVSLFLTANFQTPRYFFPLALLWESFFPLFLLSLASNISFSFLPSGYPQKNAMRLSKVLILTLLIGGHIITLVHIYLLPEGIYILP